MTEENEPQTKSDPPEIKRERMRIEALTDFFVVGVIFAGLKYDLVPKDYVTHAWAAIALIGGVGGLNKLRGKSGSASAAIATALPKAGAALLGTMKHLSIVLLAVGVLASQPGCVPFWGALPTVIAAADTVAEVVNAIADFVAQKPHDPVIDKAIVRVRSALIAFRSAASAAKDQHDGDLAAARADLLAAYQALLDLVGPLGVHAPPEDGRLASPQPGELIVPTTARLGIDLRGQP